MIDPNVCPEPEWLLLKPVLQVTDLYRDPMAYNGRDFGGPHETTHELNSKIRNKHPGCNAIYVLHGKACVIQEPKVTLTQVACEVPDDQRGSVYQMYLRSQARYWNDQPLYVLDEWGAYLNGAECYEDFVDSANAAHSLALAAEFQNYADSLQRCVAEFDPDYDSSQLERFMAYQKRRLAGIIKEWSEP